VYYFSAYSDILAKGEIKPGEKINIVVPTGNFGNILAAYYAMEMGLPVNRLVCASNENNVLTDFIKTGVYDRNREFKKTLSPSMDILISSNLERLLFELTGHDSEAVSGWMNKLRHEGIYTVDDDTASSISRLFWAGYTDDRGTIDTIDCIYKDCGYLVDTHTAVGIDVYDKYVISTGDMTKTIIASTASPFKFNGSVAKAIFGETAVRGKSEFELLDTLSKECRIPVPSGLKDLDKREIKHGAVCERLEMKETVKAILGI
jgi:threonine synthase